MKKYLIPTILILILIEAVIIRAYFTYAFCLGSCSAGETRAAGYLILGFFVVPIIGSIVSYKLYKRSLSTSTKQKVVKSNQDRYKYALLAVVLLLVTLPWSARLIENTYDAYGQQQLRQNSVASQERSRRHEQSVRESREKRHASTCVTTDSISSDLQMFALYSDFQDKKSSLSYEGTQNQLNEFNEIQNQMKQVIQLCSDKQISPTEERNQLRSLMSRGLAV